ncbi:MAG: cob(I)yrinic acid a,c-diamide adenosyltransferase [Paludibacteraceae bacterium]|nr:cob(I)yrinic acid a,c-diamide adenosyltransferase [Paludibacteraceae bacterium]
MPIYTKTGDKGTTSLVGGTRVSKASPRLNAYGTADELNSFIGLLRANISHEQINNQLGIIQNRLFRLGAYLSTEDEHIQLVQNILLTPQDVSSLEQWIDTYQNQLPPLRQFILPYGTIPVSLCHVCRTITRRLERDMVALNINSEQMQTCLQYTNRLSDFLFVLARKIAQNDGIGDFLWEN